MVTYLDSGFGPTKTFRTVHHHLSRLVGNMNYLMCDKFRDVLNLAFIQESKYMVFLMMPRPIDEGILDCTNFAPILTLPSYNFETDSASSTNRTVGENSALDEVSLISYREAFLTLFRRKGRVIA